MFKRLKDVERHKKVLEKQKKIWKTKYIFNRICNMTICKKQKNLKVKERLKKRF